MKKIICTRRGDFHDFYMVVDETRYYLFSQKYRKGVDRFYRNGTTLDKGIKHGIGISDQAIHRTMDKLKRQIRYIETENEIAVLNKTIRKTSA